MTAVPQGTLRIFFHGLCIFIPQTSSNEMPLRALLPDAGNGRSPYGNTRKPIFPHIAQLSFLETYLRDPIINPDPNNLSTFANHEFRFLSVKDGDPNFVWPLTQDKIIIRKNANIPINQPGMNNPNTSLIVSRNFTKLIPRIRDLYPGGSGNYTPVLRTDLQKNTVPDSLTAYVDLSVGTLSIPPTDSTIETNPRLRARSVETSFDPNDPIGETFVDCAVWELKIPKNTSDDNYDFQIHIENKITLDLRLPKDTSQNLLPANIYISNMPPTTYVKLRKHFDLLEDPDFEMVYKILDPPPTQKKLPRRIPNSNEPHTYPPIVCSLARF